MTLKYEVVYELECACGKGSLSTGVQDNKEIKEDFGKCMMCDKQYKLIEYEIKEIKEYGMIKLEIPKEYPDGKKRYVIIEEMQSGPMKGREVAKIITVEDITEQKTRLQAQIVSLQNKITDLDAEAIKIKDIEK